MKRGLFITIALIIIGGLFYGISGYWNKETVTVQVLDKERIVKMNDGSTNSYYLIYTDKNTYKLKDDLFYGNFRSSDWYGQIKKDSTYTFNVVGYRVGLLSSYQNIVKMNR